MANGKKWRKLWNFIGNVFIFLFFEMRRTQCVSSPHSMHTYWWTKEKCVWTTFSRFGKWHLSKKPKRGPQIAHQKFDGEKWQNRFNFVIFSPSNFFFFSHLILKEVFFVESQQKSVRAWISEHAVFVFFRYFMLKQTSKHCYVIRAGIWSASKTLFFVHVSIAENFVTFLLHPASTHTLFLFIIFQLSHTHSHAHFIPDSTLLVFRSDRKLFHFLFDL